MGSPGAVFLPGVRKNISHIIKMCRSCNSSCVRRRSIIASGGCSIGGTFATPRLATSLSTLPFLHDIPYIEPKIIVDVPGSGIHSSKCSRSFPNTDAEFPIRRISNRLCPLLIRVSETQAMRGQRSPLLLSGETFYGSLIRLLFFCDRN